MSVVEGDVTLEPVRDKVVDDSIAEQSPEPLEPIPVIMTTPYDSKNEDETVENIT